MKDILLIKHRLQINISRAALAFGHDFIVVLAIKIKLNFIFFTEIQKKSICQLFRMANNLERLPVFCLAHFLLH